MFDVDQIVELHKQRTECWHLEAIHCFEHGYLNLVCSQHAYNFQLWHQEDMARNPEATAEVIAQVKRKIDTLNQSRNDTIEKLDDWLTEELTRADIHPKDNARLNTETPGSVIDRLSILSLRTYHYQEQLDREGVDEAHRMRTGQRLEICWQQSKDLAQSLRELLEDILAGNRRHKTYRQLKMYNDPSLNPVLYSARDRQ
jgi:hypothetical protein